jgi:REP element-mobilizing transposase RayT/AraC-like DNA-binding protein
MSRPLRTQACGALYHVTARGVRRTTIYVDGNDYRVWLCMLGETAARFQFVVHAYCQMPNHFHLAVETPLGNIAAGMRYLNGKYFQYFNRKYKHLGYVSQGRYSSEIIERQEYLLEVARYVVLNPVRAELATGAAAWEWSSHRALLGLTRPPDWLHMDWLLSQFGTGPRERHIQAYAEFVQQGHGLPDPLAAKRIADKAAKRPPPAPSAAAAEPIGHYFARFASWEEAALRAYLSSAYSMRAIAQYLHMSPRTLLRLLRRLGKSL